MRVFKVYWYPKIRIDCEKEVSYVYAYNATSAMAHPLFKNVVVAEVEQVRGEERKNAIENQWCINRDFGGV